MDFTNVKAMSIPEGNVMRIAINGATVYDGDLLRKDIDTSTSAIHRIYGEIGALYDVATTYLYANESNMTIATVLPAGTYYFGFATSSPYISGVYMQYAGNGTSANWNANTVMSFTSDVTLTSIRKASIPNLLVSYGTQYWQSWICRIG